MPSSYLGKQGDGTGFAPRPQGRDHAAGAHSARPGSAPIGWEARLSLPAHMLQNDVLSLIRSKALWIRRRSFQMVYEAQQAHPGGDFSAADILGTLYFGLFP